MMKLVIGKEVSAWIDIYYFKVSYAFLLIKLASHKHLIFSMIVQFVKEVVFYFFIF